ncbi:hypothetical protein QT972_19635 [Microcoleus sp. herbarium7]|uniref:hypothetical protein n=1 Tax=Microcoleus sp. herbarium7 TaxID=3055435 RepID=UPI002FCF8366
MTLTRSGVWKIFCAAKQKAPISGLLAIGSAFFERLTRRESVVLSRKNLDRVQLCYKFAFRLVKTNGCRVLIVAKRGVVWRESRSNSPWVKFDRPVPSNASVSGVFAL